MKFIAALFPALVLFLPAAASADTQAPSIFSRVDVVQGWDGNVSAQARVGLAYLGDKPDYEMAAMWLKMAAAGGDPRSQYELGRLYAQGKGVPQSAAEANRWCGKASAQGFAAARSCLDGLNKAKPPAVSHRRMKP